jgi:hypothetical protein
MVDYYKHLNEEDNLSVKVSLPEMAKQVYDLNYGQQRFLCELLKLRESSKDVGKPIFDRQTKQLRDLIESGWY